VNQERAAPVMPRVLERWRRMEWLMASKEDEDGEEARVSRIGSVRRDDGDRGET